MGMTGRITMLGLARWPEKGGTFGQSVQRFLCTAIPWAQVFWGFFQVSFAVFYKVAALGRIHPVKEPVSSG
jgi:hypothetical protein